MLKSKDTFMRTITKSVALLLSAAALSAWATAADSAQTNAAAPAKPADKMSQLFGDTVVAKGKGLEIRRSQLDEAVISVKASLAARGQPLPAERMMLLEQGVLDRLIQMQLLLAKASETDKDKGKKQGLIRFDQIKTNAISEETLNRQLKAVGMTQEELLKKITEEATAEMTLERELSINVTDAEVKKFYDDNPAKFELPEMVRASHILLVTRDLTTQTDLPDDKKAAKRKQMEDLLKRARGGEDFAKLAREFSEDPGSKDKGGEYTFPRGQMDPQFEAAAFSLNTNQISEIVTTPYGYHIIKLSEKIPARKMDLERVSPDIKEYLTRQALQKAGVPAYIIKLRTEAGVEVLDEKLKPKENSDAIVLPAAGPAVKPDTKKP